MESTMTKTAGLGTEAALDNAHSDYASLGNLVQATINGQRLASSALETMQSHYSDPDTLYLSLKSILPDSRDIEALTTIRGFMRVLQKRIEQAQHECK